jgi:hypothetical protein
VARVVRRTLAQQLFSLARLPVTSDVTITRSRLAWRGELQPSPLSRIYTLRLTYADGHPTPAVTVVRPQLRTDEVESLPHVYPGDELCLCYPWEWDAGQLIARTIIPWASEWLLHFEIFKATGRWHGGGHDPAVLPS